VLSMCRRAETREKVAGDVRCECTKHNIVIGSLVYGGRDDAMLLRQSEGQGGRERRFEGRCECTNIAL
jgi:hypothetical protein